jgi:hypothetical protein
MDELALVQKVWNYAHLLRDQGVRTRPPRVALSLQS